MKKLKIMRMSGKVTELVANSDYIKLKFANESMKSVRVESRDIIKIVIYNNITNEEIAMDYETFAYFNNGGACIWSIYENTDNGEPMFYINLTIITMGGVLYRYKIITNKIISRYYVMEVK